MNISVKGRYALAAMIYIAEQGQGSEYIPLTAVSEKLGISKLYLEQIFVGLKKAGLVNSAKGPMGGYEINGSIEKITVYDILSIFETALFEPAGKTVSKEYAYIDKAMQQKVFKPLDTAIKKQLQSVTLKQLLDEAAHYKNQNNMMFYI